MSTNPTSPIYALRSEKGWKAFCGQAGLPLLHRCAICGGVVTVESRKFLGFIGKTRWALRCGSFNHLGVLWTERWNMTELLADAMWTSDAPVGWRTIVMDAVKGDCYARP